MKGKLKKYKSYRNNNGERELNYSSNKYGTRQRIKTNKIHLFFKRSIFN